MWTKVLATKSESHQVWKPPSLEATKSGSLRLTSDVYTCAMAPTHTVKKMTKTAVERRLSTTLTSTSGLHVPVDNKCILFLSLYLL